MNDVTIAHTYPALLLLGFDKNFQGKTLQHYHQKHPADFREIGHHPKQNV